MVEKIINLSQTYAFTNVFNVSPHNDKLTAAQRYLRGTKIKSSFNFSALILHTHIPRLIILLIVILSLYTPPTLCLWKGREAAVFITITEITKFRDYSAQVISVSRTVLFTSL